MSVIRVLRVEHLNCPSGKAHGPMGWYDDCDSYAPYFGGRGPVPQNDGPGHYMKEWEVCGVLPEQLDAWWAASERDLRGWTISEYAVPEEDVVVLKWQVIFPRESAKRVHAHYSPKPFIDCRREDLSCVDQVPYVYVY